MSIFVKFYPAGCGDAIRIKYHNKEQPPINIFIDAGYITTFISTIQLDLLKMSEKEFIDLWIITHFDNDHINGILGFFESQVYKKNPDLLKEIWFNYFDRVSIANSSSTKVGIASAIKLREKILGSTIEKKTVTSDMDNRTVGEGIITVLCPDAKSYKILGEKWESLEQEYHSKKAKRDTKVAYLAEKIPDDQIRISELAARLDLKEDLNDIANRTSIAILFEHPELSILLLGDAHSSLIIKKIKEINNIRGIERLKVDYLKLAHHASRHNFHQDLLNVIECERFIISSVGEGCTGLPNKEILSKILNRPDKSKKIYFYFNYNNVRLKQLFDIDKNAFESYNFECIFPDDNVNGLIINAIDGK